MFDGSGRRVSPVSGSRVSSSSAVPVLPATFTPGERGRRAGPVGDHVHHQRARSCAPPRGRSRARSRVARPARQRRRAADAARRRSSAPPTPVCSGVASVLNWPIAVEPTSSGVAISAAGGRVLGTSPGTSARRVPAVALGGLHEPLGARASRRAARTPSCTSGRSCRGTCRRRTRRWRSRARPRRSIAAVCDRELRRGLHGARLERGGGGHDLEGRARAAGAPRRRSRRARGSRPLRGSSAAMPPKRPASAGHGGLLDARCRSWCATRRAAARGSRRATTPPAGDQLATRPPAQPLLEGLLEPVLPDGPVAREAARVEGGALLGGLLGRHAARDRAGDAPERRGARVRRALGPAPCRRATAARPRRGASLRRVRRSPSRRPGKASCGRHSTRSVAHRHEQLAGHAAEDPRAQRPPARATAPSRSPPGSRPRTRSPWPWPAAARVGAPERARADSASRAASSSSACMARRSPRSQARGEVAGRALSAGRVRPPPPRAQQAATTAPSPPRAGSARWVRRRRRSDASSFRGGSGGAVAPMVARARRYAASRL